MTVNSNLSHHEEHTEDPHFAKESTHTAHLDNIINNTKEASPELIHETTQGLHSLVDQAAKEHGDENTNTNEHGDEHTNTKYVEQGKTDHLK